MDALFVPDPYVPQPTLVEFELDRVAVVALLASRLLMESGAAANVVHEECYRIAHGLGAERVDLDAGYVSLEITVARGVARVTRITEVGPHGVDYRLSHEVRILAKRISDGGLTPAEVMSELTRLKQSTGRHASWVVALAVGIACASFGRLLGMSWSAFVPVAASGAVGQWVRHLLLRRGTNLFVVICFVALLASGLAGLGARLVSSTTVDLAMLSSILLLVPGVPLLDGQQDIVQGYPMLGTARVVTCSMMLICMATGVLIARTLLGVRQ